MPASYVCRSAMEGRSVMSYGNAMSASSTKIPTARKSISHRFYMGALKSPCNIQVGALW